VKSESLVDRRGLSQIWPIWTPRLGRSNNRHTIYGKNSRALRTHGLSAALCAYSPYPCRTSFGHTEFQESTLCASTTPAKCWGWAGRGGAPLTPQGFGRECTGGGQWWWCVWLCLCAGGLCGGTWGTTKSSPCHQWSFTQRTPSFLASTKSCPCHQWSFTQRTTHRARCWRSRVPCGSSPAPRRH
jgi:hypothetical protein